MTKILAAEALERMKQKSWQQQAGTQQTSTRATKIDEAACLFR
jgi:hypothetical protein